MLAIGNGYNTIEFVTGIYLLLKNYLNVVVNRCVYLTFLNVDYRNVVIFFLSEEDIFPRNLTYHIAITIKLGLS